METIGEGRYRRVRAEGDLVLKTIKPYIIKRYGPVQISFPTHVYTAIKFGVKDFNEHEFRNYRKIAEAAPQLARYVSPIFRVIRDQGASTQIGLRVQDVTGETSKNMREYGAVEQNPFWEHMGTIRELMLANKIFLMDIRPENILVQDTGNELIPVLIDVKRVGPRTYPAQPWIHLPRQLAKRVQRRFERIEAQYKPTDTR